MKDISGLPNVDAPTANLINGVMNDVATPGDGTGTPVRVDWQSDLYYALIAIMNEAGITADDTAEGATSSQFKDAILRVARKQVQGPSYSNLLVKRNAGTPNSKVDIAYDKLWIEGIEDTSGTFTLDITASGLLGLDTGAEAADAWYYIWIIAKVDGTVSAILSASSTAPTMPAGYTLKRLVSMVRNTGGNFVGFVQENDRWGYVASTAIKQVSTFINETLDCTIFIPESVIKADIRLNCYVTDSVDVSAATASLYSYENGVYRLYNDSFSSDAVASRVARVHVFGTIGVSSRYIKYSTIDQGTATGVATNLWISGFEVPL
jgi:hypothetical protein